MSSALAIVLSEQRAIEVAKKSHIVIPVTAKGVWSITRYMFATPPRKTVNTAANRSG